MTVHVRVLTGATAVAIMAVAMMPGASGAAPAGPSMAASSTPVPMPSGPTTDVSAPALSFTGRYLAHVAVPRGVTSPRQQLRRTDLSTGASVLVNRSIDGGVASGGTSLPPTISADGRRIAFSSFATRLVAGDTNGRNDAFVRDLSTRTTLLASVALDGGPANGDTGMAALSTDGRYVAFTSCATDVVAGSTTTNSDVYVRDLQTHHTVQVTLRPDGSPSRGPGASSAAVSGTGTFVAFTDYDTDLVTNDDDDTDADLYVRNTRTGTTRWLSPGLPAGANPSGAVISPNGAWVSSRWADGSLHLTRVPTGVTTTVAPDAYALLGSFSGRLGRFVFLSGGQPYVRDLATGVDTPIPVPAGGSVTTVTVSGNGRFAAYDWVPASGEATRIFRVAL
jgi:Tol biopolymer transport system component